MESRDRVGLRGSGLGSKKNSTALGQFSCSDRLLQPVIYLAPNSSTDRRPLCRNSLQVRPRPAEFFRGPRVVHAEAIGKSGTSLPKISANADAACRTYGQDRY